VTMTDPFMSVDVIAQEEFRRKFDVSEPSETTTQRLGDPENEGLPLSPPPLHWWLVGRTMSSIRTSITSGPSGGLSIAYEF
jgi:hypothetical protein